MRQLHAGNLRYRLTLQQSTESRSKTGATTEAWSDLATVSAEKMDLSGREYDAESLVSTRFRIGYRADLDINAKMRCICNGKTYSLASPPLDPDGKRRELILMCKAVG
jgi:SPP1 family predicted phage head-tail adaptor